MWPAEPVNRPIAAIGPCESAGHQSPAIASLIFSFCFLSSARRAVSGAGLRVSAVIRASIPACLAISAEAWAFSIRMSPFVSDRGNE